MHGMSMPLTLPTTATSQSLEQRLEQARDLVRRVFEMSRQSCRAASRKGVRTTPQQKLRFDQQACGVEHGRRKPRQQTHPALSRHKDRPPGPAVPAGCVKARSSTLQPCSQSISSTESTASKSAGSQPMSQGSTSTTLELPAARQVMPLPAALARVWLAMLPLSTAALSCCFL